MPTPYRDLIGIEAYADTIRVWREDTDTEAISRRYSPETFGQRIY